MSYDIGEKLKSEDVFAMRYIYPPLEDFRVSINARLYMPVQQYLFQLKYK
jgi:hypothetical protein